MPNWPETLPIYPLLQGYRETISETVLRSEMDTGPAKTRQRSSAYVSQIHVQFLVNSAQLSVFRDFYDQDLSTGALSFDFHHPTKQKVVSCRFAASYEVTAVSNAFHRIQAVLEVMP